MARINGEAAQTTSNFKMLEAKHKNVGNKDIWGMEDNDEGKGIVEIG